MMALAWIACLTASMGGVAVAEEPGAAVAEAAAAPAAAAAPMVYPDADALLLALEKADVGLVSFEAHIQYDRRFALQGDQHIRRGEIYYKAEVKGADGGAVEPAVFAVKFKELQIDGSVRTEEQAFIFDGEWFIERNDAAKRFIKRQVALPGERINPLRLGEGPFPIPIGQKRVDILARYEAKLVPVDDGLRDEPDYLAAVAGGKVVATQIVLTPRAEFGKDEFREIRLWYRPEGGRLLPRLAQTLNRQGDVSFVLLVGMKVNGADFPAQVVSVDEPPAGQGWEVQTELKRAGADGHVNDE
jgi:hypothetical protein